MIRINEFRYINKCKYIDYINQGGVEPTYIDYHEMLLFCQEKDEDFLYDGYDNYIEYYLNNYIELYIIDFIDDTEKYLIDLIGIINNSTIIIQKAFRKYRYDPQYNFCKLVQTRNLLLDNIVLDKSCKSVDKC